MQMHSREAWDRREIHKSPDDLWWRAMESVLGVLPS
jgi:hypothetical protein